VSAAIRLIEKNVETNIGGAERKFEYDTLVKVNGNN